MVSFRRNPVFFVNSAHSAMNVGYSSFWMKFSAGSDVPDTLAYEAAGTGPDAVGMAKGLGGGFPIGAICTNPTQTFFNPDRMAPPLAATRWLCRSQRCTRCNRRRNLSLKYKASAIWYEVLRALAEKHSTHIAGMRSVGYMVGLQLHADCRAVAHAAREKAAHRTGRAQHRAPSAAPHHNRRRTRESVHILDAVFNTLIIIQPLMNR